MRLMDTGGEWFKCSSSVPSNVVLSICIFSRLVYIRNLRHSEISWVAKMDVPSHMVNNYGLCLESKLLKSDWHLKGGGFTIPCQHPITHQQGDYKRIKLQVPIRRSQKLSDKITALQKLVSPYGKTDTASVLQEACLYIKFIQDQIQNLLQMQSSSYKTQNPQGIQEKQGNLRSEGLCLVPLTFIKPHRIYDPTL